MRRKPRGLRPEEEALWQVVAQRAKPLFRQQEPTKRVSNPKARRPDGQGAKPAIPEFRVGEAARRPMSRDDLATPMSEALRRQPVVMDKKAYGRLTRGKLKPEGRIDLHGMTLAQAHPALTRFILSAWAAEKRLVLVITGKGRSGPDEGLMTVQRGVLKRQVPEWLRSPQLGAAVLQVTQAHRRHGGEGAYYVYLTRKR